ncbi:hypothetical protein GCM10025882_15950 [Acinetobacter gyllenbergii]|uniref:Uncharacterized protein n=1 Tax=Acinetobacter gyllenbergii CIP 110306 = MTCC 11365 TaxID=1217657 RepID=A0A829HGF3_9GAMM|nr:hypothetical protein [Acinetobacter gyllenbergii]EPF77531.1 hypothetical protein F957_02703 [Acinetobacter gyllenbergii CIP 110306 = MTCC 11365]EPH33300.1 hypothetical protein L293_0900 [Acinetobacter gyllenbergii CIP 110306 = MTCC 11365]GMA11170.1 hypothetical protein GCM10025882_15950 [Acinetobacter gyllenbergii]
MQEIKPLLELLNQLDPLPAKNRETRWEGLTRQGYKYMAAITGILFLILIILAVWHKTSPFSDQGREIAIWIAISTIFIPTMYIIIDIGVGLVSIFKFKSRSFDWLILEIAHDKKAIELLANYKKETLLEVQDWLQLKCSRLNNRISTFIGNSDKYAVFSLIGLGWSVWKELSKVPSNNGDIVQTLLLYGAAFLTGIALGSMIVNYQIQRYNYQLELIKFVLKQKN